MKHHVRILLSLAAGLALTLSAGCSGSSILENNRTDWSLSGLEPLYLNEWPENEFTAQIPEPDDGQIDYAFDASDSGRYAVFWKEIGMEESADYVERLKDQGYSEVRAEKNEVSVGTILQKGAATLSISYSSDSLSILIAIDSAP